MDLRQLHYFLTVAEEGQITKAAARLHMAQPPLSQQILQMEEELGLKLFERSGRGMVLTQAGHVLQVRAEQILEMMRSTRKELTDINTGLHGTLSIGAVASSGALLLPRLLLEYHRRFPDVDFQVWEGDTFRVSELLQAGVVEIGIIRTPFSAEGCETTTAASLQDPMVAAAGKAHRFDSVPGEALPLAALQAKPLILLRRYARPFTEACQCAGFEPQILCRSDDFRSLLAWAEGGLGIAIVPKSTVAFTGSPGIGFRELADSSLFTSVAAVWQQNRYLSAMARHFLTLFKEQA